MPADWTLKRMNTKVVAGSHQRNARRSPLLVRDNGIGMDRETREKAFTLFFSSKGTGGTGLGLFISNRIARSHGGRIELKSEAGVGTQFVVALPRSRPSDSR